MSETLGYGRSVRSKLPLRLIVLLVAGCAGFILFCWNVPGVYQCLRVRSWPSVSGVVVSKSQGSSAGSFLSQIPIGQYLATTHVGMSYTFAVNGNSFSGTGISCDETREVEVSLQYPLRSNVDVYYDPSDPSDSFIDRNLGSQTLAGLLIGVVLMIFSSASLIASKRKQANRGK